MESARRDDARCNDAEDGCEDERNKAEDSEEWGEDDEEEEKAEESWTNQPKKKGRQGDHGSAMFVEELALFL